MQQGNADLIDAYRAELERRNCSPDSVRSMPRTIDQFARWLGRRPLTKARSEDVERWLGSLVVRGHPAKPRTKNAYVARLRSFYGWALRHGHVRRDPTADVVPTHAPRLLPRAIPSDELATALEAADPAMRAMLLLGALCGLRCKEIATLDRTDVDDRAGQLRVTHGKGGHERIIPLHPEVLAALKAAPMRARGPVFREHGEPMTPARVSRLIGRHLARSGKATAHQLRHWFGQATYDASHDLEHTRELLGHASITTTSGYAAGNREEIRTTVLKLRLPELPSPTEDQ